MKRKKRNFEERMLMVSDFYRSGSTKFEFAKANGVKVSTLDKWLWESKRQDGKNQPIAGFVEVQPIVNNQISEPANCRAVFREMAFEFGSSPDPIWLSKFASSFLSSKTS